VMRTSIHVASCFVALTKAFPASACCRQLRGLQDALTGHVSGSDSRKCGLGRSLPMLAAAIGRVSFPGFESPGTRRREQA
jgi:hypothetical protein